MDDINDHVRLSAVSACSKALMNKKIKETKDKELGKEKISFELSIVDIFCTISFSILFSGIL